MTRQMSILVSFIAVLVTVAAPRAATADKRIVVLDFEGARSERLRDAVAELIGGSHRVIAGTMYRNEARRLGAAELTPENIAMVAMSLDADGVLEGTLSRRGRRYRLRLRLYSGIDGEAVRTFTLRLKGPRLSTRMRAVARRRLLAAVADLPFVDQGSEARTASAPDAGALADSPEPGPAVAEPVVSSPAEPADRGQASAGPGGPVTAPGGERVLHAPASLELGASVVSRDLSFTTVPEDFAEAPQNYEGPVAPGVYASGEIYPLAFNARPGSVLSMVGVGFELDRVLGLQTAIDTGVMTTLVPTTQMRYGVGLRVRYNIGNQPTRPTVKLALGMGRMTFRLDEDAVPPGIMLDIPNTAYSYLDPGLSVLVPLSGRVAVTGAGRFLLITDAGDVQKQEQYGAATLLGYSAQLGVEIMAAAHLVVRVAGAYTTISFDFAGNGYQTNSRDGDDATQDVASAQDRYLGGLVTLGYLF